jgi:hypothetical protein
LGPVGVSASGTPINSKELAAQLRRSAWFVSAMKAGGYRFAFGTLTTLEHALSWMAANPDFRSTEYATQKHMRPRLRRGAAGKSGESSR